MIFFSHPRIGMSGLEDGSVGPSDDTNNKNRISFLKREGIAVSRVVSVKQIHSRIVVPVQGPLREPPEADGIVTDDLGLVLAVTVADCLPIFLFDTKRRGFGIVHSGWKGTGIVIDAVDMLFKRYGIPARDLRGFIGPGIGPCCYEVDEARAGKFAGEWGEESVVNQNGSFRLDLPGTNARLLESAGVDLQAPFKLPRGGVPCTCCTPGFGSYRREGPVDFTRMIAFIGYLL